MADVDCSGTVTISDAILLLRSIVFGEALPCGIDLGGGVFVG